MKLYLSSYHFGNRPERLAELVGPNKTAAIIMNASDAYGNAQRPKYLAGFSSELAKLGIAGEELDLRDYFGRPAELAKLLAGFGLLWVSGGNTFILRRAMRESGLDVLLPKFLRDTDLVYGGFSAGACVLSPSLRGIHLADDPEKVPDGYSSTPIWEGVSVVDFYVVPHYRSEHPESAAMENVVDYLVQEKKRYFLLHDGEALVVEGEKIEKVG